MFDEPTWAAMGCPVQLGAEPSPHKGDMDGAASQVGEPLDDPSKLDETKKRERLEKMEARKKDRLEALAEMSPAERAMDLSRITISEPTRPS